MQQKLLKWTDPFTCRQRWTDVNRCILGGNLNLAYSNNNRVHILYHYNCNFLKGEQMGEQMGLILFINIYKSDSELHFICYICSPFLLIFYFLIYILFYRTINNICISFLGKSLIWEVNRWVNRCPKDVFTFQTSVHLSYFCYYYFGGQKMETKWNLWLIIMFGFFEFSSTILLPAHSINFSVLVIWIFSLH